MKIENLPLTAKYGEEISERSFYTTILSTSLWGLIAIAITTMLCASFVFDKFILLGLVILALSSPFILSYARNISTALIGYHVMIISLGMMLSAVLKTTTYNIVMSALGTTIFISSGMIVIGLLFPKIFSKLGSFLVVSLLCLIVLRLVQLFTGLYHLAWIDYLTCIIFMGFIGFDMYTIRVVARTPRNAIMIGVSLFLDFINIFLAILNIKSRD